MGREGGRAHSTAKPHLLQLPHFLGALAVLGLQAVHLCGGAGTAAAAGFEAGEEVGPLGVKGRCRGLVGVGGGREAGGVGHGVA